MDVLLENHGSTILLRPVSVRADEWLHARLEPDAQFFGGAAAVEQRYLGPILDGLKSDGLEARA